MFSPFTSVSPEWTLSQTFICISTVKIEMPHTVDTVHCKTLERLWLQFKAAPYLTMRNPNCRGPLIRKCDEDRPWNRSLPPSVALFTCALHIYSVRHLQKATPYIPVHFYSLPIRNESGSNAPKWNLGVSVQWEGVSRLLTEVLVPLSAVSDVPCRCSCIQESING